MQDILLQSTCEQVSTDKAIFELAFGNNTIALAVTDENMVFEMVNTAFVELSGYSRDEIVGEGWHLLLNTEDLQAMKEYYLEKKAKQIILYNNNDFQIIDKQGHLREVIATVSDLKSDGKKVVSLLDITKRKEMEKKIQNQRTYFQALIEHTPLAVVAIDLQGNVTTCNPSFEKLFHYSRLEVLGQSLDELITEDKKNGNGQSFTKRILTGGRSHVVTVCYRKDGSPVDIEMYGVPIRIQGSDIGAFAIFQDITERKWAEAQLISSLKEKELLLEEVHHRVKNNLQIISSMLRLQSGYIEDLQALEMFRISQNRVRSMALVHEKIYQSKDMTKINFGEYVRDLTGYLFHSYKANNAEITVRTQVKDVKLGIDTAIPCGLIVNELVSNSLRHAFSDGRKGEIYIDLYSENGTSKLIVGDNGTGLPSTIDFRTTDSLGFQIVNTLTEQLSGTISLKNSNGTEFMIMFDTDTQ